MKKLLFILSALLISMLGWAAVTKTTLNPYAYDLKTEYWNNETQQLVVSFKLTAKPNTDVSANNNKRGIQIYAYEPSNPSVKYCIYQVPANEITDNTTLQYTCTIPMDGMSKENEVELRRRLPEGKDLTWEVRVQGVNSANANMPQNIDLNGLYRPYSCHGIAVQTCQDAPDFGSIYVTEASTGGSGVWQWIGDKNKGRSLLKYSPRLDEEPTAYQKSSAFSQRTNTTLEPHRVRISDDGRIFVSSYNKNVDATKKQVDVWEFKVNSNGTHSFDPIIYHNYTANGVYGDRVCGMDVKGEGANLKILLCLLDEYDNINANSFQAYEYNIGSLASGASTNTGTRKWRYRPVGNTYDVSAGEDATPQGVIERARNDKWSFYTDGFVNISYGAKNKNDILLAVDYFQGSWFNANIMYFKDGKYSGGNTTPGFQVAEDPTGSQNVRNHIYGGAGMLTYLDGNTEYVISGRAQYHGYENDPNVATLNKEEDGRIHMYQLESGNVSATARNNYSVNVPTRAIINDMAMDHAHNLYAVSFTDGTNNVGSGRIVAVALPYDGETVTAAPKTEQKFQFNPVKLSEDEDVYTIPAKLKGQDCSVYLKRRLSGGTYNTICLPFDVNINQLPDGHPYKKDADILAFDHVVLPSEANGDMLELCFVQVNDGQMLKNTPYLIKPKNDILDEVSFDNVKLDPYTDFSDERYQVTKDNITFWGIIPSASIKITDPENDIVLILVADNRLASVTTNGTILGFRGFFYFDRRNVPANVGARIAERKPTPTSVINLNGEQVDVEKFLREGRVYIRMGEDLYTINGEKVE